ncbi:hypothetical protein FAZ95_13730 [Trinickia violacea]|uniref:Uncharacterized protein n=1 Tax=Trinickia violacea TaxID=2571746 RepID=A0A4P8ISD0_9BURK|nr:hypothetical protein [Trinickia violacea]QCP50143.1 hypothetical protein FAZ95_13730 [Trinickia violacea]
MKGLIVYFHAHGALDFALLMSNGLIATVIVGILMFTRMTGDSLIVRRAALVRYAFVVGYGVLAIRVWFGYYHTPVEPTEVAVNAVVLWLIRLVRGDFVIAMHAVRLIRARRAS